MPTHNVLVVVRFPADLLERVDLARVRARRKSRFTHHRAALFRAAVRAVIGEIDLTQCSSEDEMVQVIQSRLEGSALRKKSESRKRGAV